MNLCDPALSIGELLLFYVKHVTAVGVIIVGLVGVLYAVGWLWDKASHYAWLRRRRK